MANGIPISQLAPVSSITGAEIIPLVQNGVTSSGTPALLASYLGGLSVGYTAYTANHQMTAGQTGGTFSNAGATGSITLTLPTPVVSLTYTFVVAAAQTLLIDVDGSVVIAVGELTSSAGGFVSSDSPYSVITLKAISTSLWVATFVLGTWQPQ